MHPGAVGTAVLTLPPLYSDAPELRTLPAQALSSGGFSGVLEAKGGSL